MPTDLAGAFATVPQPGAENCEVTAGRPIRDIAGTGRTLTASALHHLRLVPFDLLVLLFIGQAMVPAPALVPLVLVNVGTWWCYHRIPDFLSHVSGVHGKGILIPGPIVGHFARFISSCGIHHRAHYGLMLTMMAGFHAGTTATLWDQTVPFWFTLVLAWSSYACLLFIDSGMFYVSLRTLQELRLNSLQDANRYTEDLRRSNEDLEQFAYIAAHDLRTPLRGILNLTQWMREDVERICSRETRDHLDMLQNRVERMDRLLNDLLHYSRIGRPNVERETFNLGEMTRAIFESFSDSDRFYLEVTDPAPHINDHPITFELLLGNLIGNAIKHHHGPDGVIRVTLAATDSAVTIRVEDNGPGIPEQYREKIFHVFSTLQSRDEKEASGMGLAIVRKIVMHKQGTVTVSDSPLGGACFEVTLPVDDTSI